MTDGALLDVLGLRLEHAEWPASRPGLPELVLLHEGLGCVAMWGRFPERLASATGCRVIAYSRPGHGRSTPYPERRTPRYLHREAEAVLPAVLSALGLRRPILVGHSDGGSIALIFAGRFPGATSGIAVMAPHEFVEEVTLEGLRRARLAWASGAWRSRLGRYHTDPDRVFAEWNETWLDPAFRDWNIEDCLPAIRCPVLAIQGERDEYATMRQIDVIAEKVPSATLLKLPDCGHSPHKDQEAAVTSAIAAFVERAVRAGEGSAGR